MRPAVLPVVLALAAACLLARPLAAQHDSPLDRGTTLDVRFTGRDASPGAGVSHTYVYARPVRRGTTLHVHVWGSFTELNTRFAPRVSISDPDAADDGSGTTRTRGYTDASITASKTFDRPGRVLITVSSGPEAVGRGYTIRVEDPATLRSVTTGLHLAAGYGSTSLRGTDGGGETAGEGFSLRLGAGLDPRVTVFAEGQAAGMSPRDSVPGEEAYDYRLLHAELGARLYLLGSWSRLRPFVQGAVGGRRVRLDTRPIEAQGISLTPGGGVELFLRPGLAVEGGVRTSWGKFTRWRATGGEWRDIPPEYDLHTRTTRVHLQLVAHR